MFSWKLAIGTLLLLVNSNFNGNIYSQTMAVVEVDDDYVTCVDFNGNEWAFDNTSDDWYRGDLASCIMYDNGTDEIYDDEILSAKYTGWVAGSWGYDAESGCEIAYFDY